MHAWQVYMEEFRRRAEPAAESQFERSRLLGDAAHEAYQAAADRLTRDHAWQDEEALVVMRGLMTEVKTWIDGGDSDWQALGESLRRMERDREGNGGAAEPGNN
ncbi:MAG TPA: hypothetical protein VK928_06700 [Longimicrobiales bacterium]|nr:hypothetical protein [Longimicrobiales bacterium]